MTTLATPLGHEAAHPVQVRVEPALDHRDRLTTAFRLVLAIPHLIIVSALGLAWTFTTLVAWVAILLTGRFPAGLYHFGEGVLRWTTRVEAYLFLLHDAYPPFSLE